MPKFCFNWSLTGSTIIEAKDVYEARAKWDKIATNSDLITTASSVDFSEDSVFTESPEGSGYFEEDPEPPAPGSNDPNCTHYFPNGDSAWAYTGEPYGGDEPGEGRCYCLLCGADGDA